MDVSIFLAKYLGLYFAVAGAFLWHRRDLSTKIMADFFKNSALVAFGGAIAFLFGTLILLVHPIFELNWKLLITLIGLFATVQGLARLFIPEKIEELSKNFAKDNVLVYTAGVLFVIGVFLLYKGFTS